MKTKRKMLLGWFTMLEEIHSMLCGIELDDDGEPHDIQYTVSDEIYSMLLEIDEIMHKKYITNKDMEEARGSMRWAIRLSYTYGDGIPFTLFNNISHE